MPSYFPVLLKIYSVLCGLKFVSASISIKFSEPWNLYVLKFSFIKYYFLLWQIITNPLKPPNTMYQSVPISSNKKTKFIFNKEQGKNHQAQKKNKYGKPRNFMNQHFILILVIKWMWLVECRARSLVGC